MQRRLRDSKKGGVSSEQLFFIAGIIIAVIITVLVVKLIFSWLVTDDDTEKKFDSMTSTIKSLPANSLGPASDSNLVHLDYDETMLFFDKDSKGLIKISGVKMSSQDINDFAIQDINNFVIAAKEPILIHLLNKQFQPDVLKLEEEARIIESKDEIHYEPALTFRKIFFKKPSQCGISACAVLCKSFIISRMTREEINQNIDSSIIKESKNAFDNFFMATCKPDRLSYFENIEHFYIKPKYEFFAGVVERNDAFYKTDAWVSANSFLLNSYFYGAGANVPLQGFSNFEKITKGSEFKSGESYYLFTPSSADFTFLFMEYPFSSNRLLREFDRNQFVTFTKIGAEVILCYDRPCLTKTEEKYFDFKRVLMECVKSAGCNSLFNNFKDYIRDQSSSVVVFTKNEKLKIRFNATVRAFETNFEIFILKPVVQSDGQIINEEIAIGGEELQFTIQKYQTDDRLLYGDGTFTYRLIELKVVKSSSEANVTDANIPFKLIFVLEKVS